MFIETELKLRIAPDSIESFLQLPLLQSATYTSKHQHLYSTYFDTQDLALLQQGMGLRVRQVGQRRLQTLKTAGTSLSGLHQRQEWETEITGDTPDYRLLSDSPLANWCADEKNREEIGPLFTTDFVRTVWNLTYDGSDIELALDQGEIKTATASVPISEVELELKSGTPDKLFQVALKLQQHIPLSVENKSKAARGYAIYRPSPPESQKASPTVGLSMDMTAEQAFINILGHCLEHLQANEDVVLYGDDVEGIHQMRVALRRLRSCLNLYKPLIPNQAHTKVRREIKWMANVLGVARDWDVFNETLQQVQGYMQKDKMWSELLSNVAEQRATAYVAVRETLQHPRYSRMLLMLGKWLVKRSWRLHLPSKSLRSLEQPAVTMASTIQDKHYQEICQDGEKLRELDPEARHQLRISVKKLAYGVRFFAELYQKNELTARLFAKSLSQLQEGLGILNDANTATNLLNQIELDEKAPVRYFLNGWYAHQEFMHLGILEAAWQHWREQEVFWKL